MNLQLTNSQAQPDVRIDQVLEALRTTDPPVGLEERVAQRIAARLAQAAEARQANAPQARPFITTDNPSPARAAASSYVAVILNAVKDPCSLFAEARLYTLAAALTLLLTVTTITILHHRTTTALTPAPSPSLEGAGLQSRHNAPTTNPALAAKGISRQANTQIPQAFSLGSHSPIKNAEALAPAQQPDPDTIALAETLAPSHPAPPMPLTSQERLMLAATRPGQPIEVAELDIARAPFLRAAAQAREDANLRRYVRALLAPFAIADELSPTTVSHPREINTQAPAPQPPSSLTN